MKKSIFLLPVFALMFVITGCSNQDSFNDSPDDKNIEGEANFLTINIVQSTNMGSRAGESNEEESDDYEYGTSTENAVSKIRFYFFNADGSAAAVKSNGTNFYDWVKEEDSESSGGPNENIEKILQAIVVINTSDGDALPAGIVAILNPDNVSLGIQNLDLSDLQNNFAKDYATWANDEDPVFVMSNSIYYDDEADTPVKVIATPVTMAHYAKTPDEAIKNPVQIYVERTMAKVNVDVKISEDTQYSSYDAQNELFTLKDKNGKAIEASLDGSSEKLQVYLKLKAWDLTADTNIGGLIKNIDSQWISSSDFFGEAVEWNKARYSRSFWAKNHNAATQSWYTFSDITKNGLKVGKDVKYTNENAPQKVYNDNYGTDFSADNFTKVILAGQLQVNENGEMKNVTIAKYAGQLFAGTSFDKAVTALTKAVVESLGTNMIYYKDGDDYKPLTSDLLTVKSAIDVDKATTGETTSGRYNVYFQLKRTGEILGAGDSQREWYSDSKGENKIDDVDHYLINTIGRAQIYNDGKTYFYFPIKHFGKTGTIGECGVVRNHLYKCEIFALAGLGTPVFDTPNNDDPTDEEELIYPEKPTDDESFILAQVNILSWRIASDKVSLIW